MGLIDGLSGVIYSNLIREGRYLLFFQGLWTTLEITAFALLLAINGAGAMMLFLSLYSLIQTVV